MTERGTTVVFLVSTLRQTGPTSQLLNLVRYLDTTTVRPVVVTLSREPEDSMHEAFEQLGATVRSIELSRLRGALRRRWRQDIERLTGRSLSECVVHTQGLRADRISAHALTGIARVSTARNYPFDDYVMKFGPVTGRLMAHSQISAFRSIPRIVSCSSTLARLLQRHGIESTVIRNGVDTTKYQVPSRGERISARAELGLSGHSRVAVCIGSLVARKDPITVVHAMRRLDDAHLVMIFVGSGELEDHCRAAAAPDRRIRFAGHVADVRRYLHAADFFVSASCSEGMPNAALESLACGLPMALSAIEPHRELLELAPGAGELVAIGDVTALADAVHRLASGQSAAKGLSSGAAEQLVGARSVARRYQALYESMSAERAR